MDTDSSASASAAGDAPADSRAAALAAYKAGEPAALERVCRHIVATSPGDEFGAATLTRILWDSRRHDEALQVSEAACAATPDLAVHHLNLAHLLMQRREFGRALECARTATRVEPGRETAWINHASAAYQADALSESLTAADQVLRLNPNSYGGYTNRATVLKAMGRVQEAVADFTQARQLAPDAPTAHTNLLLSLLYDETVGINDVVDAAMTFAARFEAPLRETWRPHALAAVPGRRLRVAFISPDLMSHAVMYFLEPVALRLPRTQFEIWAYFTGTGDDAITRRLRTHLDGFVDLAGWAPEAAAARIRADEIDILVDVAGHTARNALPIMCHRPAPVQLTWLGYPGTTGLEGMTWRVTDAVADPPEVDAEQYSERLWRMPGPFCVYRPHIRNLRQRFSPEYAVRPSPVLTSGQLTLGSCNNVAKISAKTVHAWGRILRALPRARLLVEAREAQAGESTQHLLGLFAREGIEAARVHWVNRDPARQYLLYHEIDIGLDTFPLTGGTTTFDALWMGVPVVTVQGQCFRERISASILIHGGWPEDVCADEDAYVRRVVELAGDPEALNARRLGQRAQMQQSALMNEPLFVTQFAQALRGMWAQWCQLENLESSSALPGATESGLTVQVEGRPMRLQRALHEARRARSAGQGADAGDRALAILRVVPEHQEARAIFEWWGAQADTR